LMSYDIHLTIICMFRGGPDLWSTLTLMWNNCPFSTGMLLQMLQPN
jgi:hypothetical protein